MLTSAIATPETDAKLREEYQKAGLLARSNGVRWEDCPVDGLIKHWWLEGWHTPRNTPMSFFVSRQDNPTNVNG